MSISPVDPSFGQAAPARVIGLMSGTSLDGVDLCAVELSLERGGRWSYRYLAGETVAYAPAWIGTLEEAYRAPDADREAGAWSDHALSGPDVAYGTYLGELVDAFLRKHESIAQGVLVASHGHTIHHRPADGYTFQLGDLRALSTASGADVVGDFRSLDVQLGGQGAPLVPVADELLFGGYAQCLNLGGFANVSYRDAAGRRIAFDIAVANMLLNALAAKLDLPFDAGGRVAASGRADLSLLTALNTLPFYASTVPKSLGREWFERAVWPLFAGSSLGLADQMATAAEHIAHQLASSLNLGPEGEVLVTGGGAHNADLLARTRRGITGRRRLVLPRGELIEFKEAIAFALLGALRWRGEVNAYASVTGATRDSCGGRVVVNKPPARM